MALAEKKTEETRVTLLQRLRAPESHFGDSVETPEDAREMAKQGADVERSITLEEVEVGTHSTWHVK